MIGRQSANSRLIAARTPAIGQKPKSLPAVTYVHVPATRRKTTVPSACGQSDVFVSAAVAHPGVPVRKLAPTDKCADSRAGGWAEALTAVVERGVEAAGDARERPVAPAGFSRSFPNVGPAGLSPFAEPYLSFGARFLTGSPRPRTQHGRTAPVRRAARRCRARRRSLVQHVRCTQVQHERPCALSDLELTQLLAQPRPAHGHRHPRSSRNARARGTRALRARAPGAHRRAGTRPPTRQVPAAPRSHPSAESRPSWSSSCADQSAGAPAPSHYTPKRTTRSEGGMPPAPSPRPTPCSSACARAQTHQRNRSRHGAVRRHRRHSRHRRRRARGPPHRPRAQAHLLHDARRTRRRPRSHQRARPRRTGWAHQFPFATSFKAWHCSA